MTDRSHPDYYEVLQLSSHADHDTIVRVYRHLARRFHPDNRASGDTERFTQLTAAFRVLSDPEQRAQYDVHYDQQRRVRWRVFDQESALDDVESDRRLRAALLSLLYTARRNDAEHPGMGIVDVESLLGCPEEHMKFHIWYLRERGLLQRLENGMLAITVAGVDHVLERGGPVARGRLLLESADSSGPANRGEAPPFGRASKPSGAAR